MSRLLQYVLLGLFLLVLSACSYYEFTDNASGKQYLSKAGQFNMNAYTGSLGLTDLQTGNFVVLQTYEMRKVPKDEAERRLGIYHDR